MSQTKNVILNIEKGGQGFHLNLTIESLKNMQNNTQIKDLKTCFSKFEIYVYSILK
jgi:hypothetical protein